MKSGLGPKPPAPIVDLIHQNVCVFLVFFFKLPLFLFYYPLFRFMVFCAVLFLVFEPGFWTC